MASRRSHFARSFTFALLSLSFCMAACQAPAATPKPNPREQDLPLRLYQPRSRLHVPATELKRLRFPAVDFHQHLPLPHEQYFVPPVQLVQMMDRWNVAAMVNLTGGHGIRLDQALKTYVSAFPERFYVFAELDWEQLRHQDFGARMASDVRRAVAQGARGLKLLKWFGLGARHPDGKLVRVDDERFDPVFATCAELGVPVAIHTGDPEAFFDPVDAHNERLEELSLNPDWSYHDSKWPRLPELLAARDRVIARHRQTVFVALHVGGWPENLDYVSHLLDHNPNVFVDMGARQAELGRQPRRARAFIMRHQDRVLFGTDETPASWNALGAAVYESYGRFLETSDEAFAYYGSPRQGRWTISGLELPDTVLEKLYVKNAHTVLGGFAQQ